MSLLLEALKKAEKAKEEAQRQSKASETVERPSADTAPAQSAPRRVVTRAELPDISQPLEILSEDLRAEPARRSSPLALEPEPARGPSSTTAGGGAASAEIPFDGATESRPRAHVSASRPAEARFREPNPNVPFYASLGVLGILTLTAIAYFWVQLRPAPAFVNSNPARPATERPVDLSQLKPGTAGTTGESRGSSDKASPPSLPAPAASATGASPAEPNRTASSADVPAPLLPDQPAKPRQPEPAKAAAPKGAAAARDTAATAGAAQSGEPSRALTVNRAATRIHPSVQSGYASYQAGDLSSAHAAYRQALREEPGNRDALLGLAAVETRAQRYEQAEAYYQRLLEADPRDPHAHAGMLALRGQRVDPVQAESRIKTILAADPDANVLYFTLGNQYAQQGRWAEAHQAYAKAHAADTENPDFAFNLAVSLDQLRQPGPALEYYRRALELAAKRAAHFAPEAVRQRVQQLSR